MARLSVFIVVVVLAQVLQFATARSQRWLAVGEIGYQTSILPSGLYEVNATDGSAALSAVVSLDTGFVTCVIDDSPFAARKIIADRATVFIHIGERQTRDLWRRCRAGVTLAKKTSAVLKDSAVSGKASRRASPTQSQPMVVTPDLPFDPEVTGDPEGPGAHLAIVPGTHWCGTGNVATDYDDLGPHNETDACCRIHDHCPYYIPGFANKYHYNNAKPWTLSMCDCDKALFRCLKHVHNANADTVGQLFYGLLGVQCFDFSTGEYCTHYHWTHLWCTEHETGPKADVHDFPFRWSDNVDDSALIG